jgi:hypothetical protein
MVETRDVLAVTGLALTGILLFSRGAQAAGAGTLTGIVRDIYTNVPIAGATVTIGAKTGYTEANGIFSIPELIPGIYSVAFTASGYGRVIMNSVAVVKDINYLDILMEPVIEVTTSLTGVVFSNTTGTPLTDVMVSLDGHSAVTDGTGRYQIDGVEAGTYVVRASREGYLDFIQAGVYIMSGSNSLSLALKPTEQAGTLSGQVTDVQTGSPVPNAIVQCSDKAATADSNGRYEIAGILAGLYVVTVTVSQYATADYQVTIRANQVTTLNLQLQSLIPQFGSVSGVVVDADTLLPVSGALVACAGQSDITGTDGSYSIINIPPGSRVLLVTRGGYNDAQATVAIVAGQVTSSDIQLHPTLIPPKFGNLIGQIYDGDTGSPLSEATVACAGKSTNTAANGTYSINDILPGTYIVSVNKAGYGPGQTTIDIIAGETSNVDLSLMLQPPTTGSITGQICDIQTGTPIVGASVVCAGISSITDSAGVYSLVDVDPGSQTINVSAAGYIGGHVTVTVTVGKTTHQDITMVPEVLTGNVSGKVSDAAGIGIGGATIVCGGVTVLTGAAGAYSITGLAPGSHSIEVSRTGYYPASGTVTIVAGQTATTNITLELIPTTADISGTVRNEAGDPLPGVSVSIDDTSLVTDTNGQYALLNVPAGTYTFILSKSGYITQTFNVTITAGIDHSVNSILHLEVPVASAFDHGYMMYDYFSNPYGLSGRATHDSVNYGSDGCSAVHVPSVRPRFFSIACHQGITDVILRLKTEQLTLFSTYKSSFASFVAECQAHGIRVWSDISIDYWDSAYPDQPDIIEREGPRLVKALTDYNNSVVAESRVYGVWAYVDFWLVQNGVEVHDWSRVITWYRSLKAAATGPIVWGSFLSFSSYDTNRDTMLRELQIADIGYGNYCRNLTEVIATAESCAAAADRVGTPFRICLGNRFDGGAYQNLRPCPDIGLSSSQQARYDCLEGAFRSLKDQVDTYFYGLYPNTYRGTVVQDYPWGPNVCFPVSYSYDGPCRNSSVPTETGSLRGTVTDDDTGAAISGATINCGGHTATTGSSGTYVITGIPVGSYVATCDAPGYTGQQFTANITANQTATVNVVLVTGISTGYALDLPCDDEAGTRVEDISGNSLHGTLMGSTPTWAPADSAIVCSPTSWVEVPYNTVLDCTDGVRLEAEIFPTVLNPVVSLGYDQPEQYIISRYYRNPYSMLLFYNSATNQNLLSIGFTVGTVGKYLHNLNCPVALNQWSKVKVEIDAKAGAVHWYVNGVLLSTTADIAAGSKLTVGTRKLWVGTCGDYSAGVSIRAFNGKVRNVKVSSLIGSTPTAGTVAGKVTNASTGAAIVGATVAVAGVSVLTDASGNYGVTNIPVGNYAIAFSATGFTDTSGTVTITSGSTATVNVSLAPVPTVDPYVWGNVHDSAGVDVTDATLTLTGPSGQTMVTYTGAVGTYEFKNIPTGACTLKCEAPSHTTQQVSIAVVATTHIQQDFTMPASGGPVTGIHQSVYIWYPGTKSASKGLTNFLTGSRANVWDFCSAVNANELLMCVTDDDFVGSTGAANWASFISEAKANGIDVWALLGSTEDWATANFPTILRNLAIFNANHSANQRFVGFTTDMEPFIGDPNAGNVNYTRYAGLLNSWRSYFPGVLSSVYDDTNVRDNPPDDNNVSPSAWQTFSNSVSEMLLQKYSSNLSSIIAKSDSSGYVRAALCQAKGQAFQVIIEMPLLDCLNNRSAFLQLLTDLNSHFDQYSTYRGVCIHHLHSAYSTVMG